MSLSLCVHYTIVPCLLHRLGLYAAITVAVAVAITGAEAGAVSPADAVAADAPAVSCFKIDHRLPRQLRRLHRTRFGRRCGG